MIITKEAQQRVIENYRKIQPTKLDQLIAFKEGMDAMWELVIKTDKADKKQKEHMEKINNHYGQQKVVFEIQGNKLKPTLKK